MDRATYAAEFASAASFGLWTVFGSNNVDDDLTAAYEAQYAGEATSQSLHEQWQEMMERGPDSMNGFIHGLKGKVAEFNAKDSLESNGYTDVSLHPDPTNEGWDISAINPDGEPVTISVKTGVSDSQYYDTLEAMRETDFPFALGAELHERVSENAPELADRILVDIGPDYMLVAGMEDGLGTLSSNMGLDIPDGVVELVPYAGAVFAASRLLMSVLKAEKEFKAADRTTKNKIQVVQTPDPDVPHGNHHRLRGWRGSGRRTSRQFLARHRQPHRRHWRLNRWGRNRHVPEPPSPTPHAQSCTGHYRADQRRPVLLQEQASHRHGGLELPNDCQGTGSRSRIIGLQIARYP